MSVFEAIGFAWVVLATGIFTAATLIAAVWSIILGFKVALRRYKLGEELTRAIDGEPKVGRTR